MTFSLFFKNHNHGHPHLPNGLMFPRGVAFLSDGVAWYSGVNFGGSVMPVPLANPDWPSIKKWVAECFGDCNPTDDFATLTWPLSMV